MCAPCGCGGRRHRPRAGRGSEPGRRPMTAPLALRGRAEGPRTTGRRSGGPDFNRRRWSSFHPAPTVGLRESRQCHGRPLATAAEPHAPSFVAAVRAAWTTARASRPPCRPRGWRVALPAPRVSELRIASWTCSSMPPTCCSSPVAAVEGLPSLLRPVVPSPAAWIGVRVQARTHDRVPLQLSWADIRFDLDATEDCRGRAVPPSEVAIRRAGALTRGAFTVKPKCGGISYADT
jgi:hypothetical protein